MRTGVGLARTYSPATVAALLHIRTRDVTGLEWRALRQLRLSARRHACGAAGHTLVASSVFGALGSLAGGTGLVGGENGALGEVMDLRYASHAPPARSGRAGKHAYPDGGSLLGVNMPPESADTWLIAVMIVAGVLLAAFLFADEQWRSRWLRRPPR